MSCLNCNNIGDLYYGNCSEECFNKSICPLCYKYQRHIINNKYQETCAYCYKENIKILKKYEILDEKEIIKNTDISEKEEYMDICQCCLFPHNNKKSKYCSNKCENEMKCKICKDKDRYYKTNKILHDLCISCDNIKNDKKCISCDKFECYNKLHCIQEALCHYCKINEKESFNGSYTIYCSECKERIKNSNFKCSLCLKTSNNIKLNFIGACCCDCNYYIKKYPNLISFLRAMKNGDDHEDVVDCWKIRLFSEIENKEYMKHIGGLFVKIKDICDITNYKRKDFEILMDRFMKKNIYDKSHEKDYIRFANNNGNLITGEKELADIIIKFLIIKFDEKKLLNFF